MPGESEACLLFELNVRNFLARHRKVDGYPTKKINAIPERESAINRKQLYTTMILNPFLIGASSEQSFLGICGKSADSHAKLNIGCQGKLLPNAAG